MHAYLKVMRELVDAPRKENRTGIDTLSRVFNHTEFKLDHGRYLPLVTTKHLATKGVLGELLGFIRGADNAQTFRELGCNVWNDNANKQNPPDQPQNKWLASPFRKGEDDLGRIYGVQWRNWRDTRLTKSGEGDFLAELGYERVGQFFKKGEDKMTIVWHREIDQLANVVNEIRNNPNSRRMIISAWNPADMEGMALPPCHVLQHYICEELSLVERLEAHIVKSENNAVWNNQSREQPRRDVMDHIKNLGGMDVLTHEHLDDLGAPKHSLNLIMYQRSADYMLGSPFNIASYGMMINMMARMTGTSPGSLHYLTGDTHLYTNHLNAAREQLRRTPMGECPRLLMDPRLQTLEDFEKAKPENFRIFNYHNRGKLNHETPMAL